MLAIRAEAWDRYCLAGRYREQARSYKEQSNSVVSSVIFL
ncbi:hypothetical protein C4K26_2288 [Pseudomonas chlororaphis]|nr:hypothetical protein C4K26_2288 [Pseudomonas chlororaphis]